MTDQPEALDLETVAATAAYAAHRKYRDYANLDDLRQEAWLWILEHPARVEKHQEDGHPRAAGWLISEVIRALEVSCRREKALVDGYEAHDESFYGRGMVALALPAVLAGTTEPPARAEAATRSKTDPSEGLTWLAVLADAQRAWEGADLTNAQRDLVVAYYGGDASQADLGRTAGVTASAVARRLERALDRMVDFLGGPKPGCPRGCQECEGSEWDWRSEALRKRPGVRQEAA